MSYDLSLLIINPIFLIIIAAIGFWFWLAMLKNCIKKTFAKPAAKVVWVLVIVLFQALGALVYWITVGRKV